MKNVDLVRRAQRSPAFFAAQTSGFALRQYQQDVAQTLFDAVLSARGGTCAVMFPRQSGKNTLQAVLEASMLWRYQYTAVEMVKISPTWKPQAQNAMRRLQNVLESNRLTRRRWRKEHGYIYRFGRARLCFLSGAPEANIVGATASLLLQVDEAQDVLIAKYDKDVAPMAASTNALRIFWGTAWTAETLLGRELRLARRAEEADGMRRAFVLTAAEVGREVPAYAAYVEAQIARLGRDHPLVRSQYFCEEVDAAGGLFDERRLALMQGDHPPQVVALPGKIYAFLLDVGGEEEGARAEGGRDSTALTIVEVVTAGGGDAAGRPVYRVAARREWTGARHSDLHTELRRLAEEWQARAVVVDATGIGAGLASFLEASLPCRVVPFVFSSASKSRLGWSFLALIETGRFLEYAPVRPDDEQTYLHARFLRQLRAVRQTVKEGVERTLVWGVPDGTRDVASGEILHDDLVISAALCALLDDLPWGTADSLVIPPASWMDERGMFF